MIQKPAVIALVAFITIQVQGISFDISVADVTKHLDELVDSVNSQVDREVKIVAKLPDELESAAASVLISGNEEIDNFYRKLSQQFSDLQKHSRNKDISKCLTGEEEILEYKPDRFKMNIYGIFQRMLEIFIEYETKAIDCVQNEFVAIDFIKQELEKCEKTDTDCLSKISDLINHVKETTPSQIRICTKQVHEEAKSFSTDLKDNLDVYIIRNEAIGEHVFNTISECVSHLKSTDELENTLSADIRTVKQLLDNLESGIKENTEKAVSSIEDAVQKLISDTVNLKKDSILKIKQATESLGKRLNGIKNAAKQQGLDIQDCLVDSQDQFRQLPKLYLNRVDQCQSDTVNQIYVQRNNAMNNIQKAYIILADLSNNANACLKGIDTDKCLDKVADDVSQAIRDVPGEIIGSNVTMILKQVVTLTHETQLCMIGSSHGMSTEGEEIINKIDECVKNKKTVL